MSAEVGTGIVAELGDLRLGRDRRARGDGCAAGHLPRRNPAAGGVDHPAVHVHGGDRGRLHRLLHRGGRTDRGRLLRRLPADLLAVPEPSRRAFLNDQGDDHGDRNRAGRLLLRLYGLGRTGGGGYGYGKVDGAQHCAGSHHRYVGLLGSGVRIREPR